MPSLVDYPTSACSYNLLLVKEYFPQEDFVLKLIENFG